MTMKKRIILAILLLAALILTPVFYAYAYEPVKAEVAVEISQGGTVVIIPEVNCPVPEKTELKLSDGEIGKLDIYFTDVGVYHYTVKIEPDKRKLIFDDREYRLEIHITDEDGQLKTTVIVYTDDGKYSSHSSSPGQGGFGPERILFSNIKRGEPVPPEPPTEPAEETTTSSKNRNPKTGDDSKMEQYFVIAMLASAGLFALSVVYMIDTNRMLKKKDD